MIAVRPAVQSKRAILLVGRLSEGAGSLRQALDELGLDDCEIRSVAVAEAWPCLQGMTEAKPGVVLLALEGSSGEELSLLKRLKEDGRLWRLPVVVLGPSGDSCLVGKSFALGAAGYMAKSADSRELAALVHTVGQYWKLSELPTRA